MKAHNTKDKQTYVTFGDEIEIKAIGGGIWEVKGALVLFGTPGEADFVGDYFTADTDYDLVDGKGVASMYFNHGQDAVIGKARIGRGKAELTKDERAIWIKGHLDEAEEYDGLVIDLIHSRQKKRNKRFGFSSGVPAHLAEKTRVKGAHEITKWSLGGDASITLIPMDYRHTIQDIAVIEKSNIKSLLNAESSTEPEAVAKAQADPAVRVLADAKGEGGAYTTSSNATISIENSQVEVKIMPEQEKTPQVEPVEAAPASQEPQAPEQTVQIGVKELVALEVKAALADIEQAKPQVKTTPVNEPPKNQDEDKEQPVDIAAAVKAGIAEALGGKPYVPPPSQSEKQNNDGMPVKHWRLEVLSRYASWNAADHQFAMNLEKKTRGSSEPINLNLDQAALREYADKAEKEYQAGTLVLDEAAIKSIHAIKADELNYSTQSGFGDENVFTDWESAIWLKPRQSNPVALAFRQIEMLSEPYEYPVENADPDVFFVGETTDEDQLGRNDSSAAIPDSKVGSAKVQFNSKKHALRINISAELEEDAQVRLIPQYRDQAERAIKDALDNVTLNGDKSASGNINLDGGTPGVTAKYKAYDGLLHQAIITTTANAVDASGAAPTLSHFRTLRSKLGTPEGYNPSNLAIFTDFQTYMKLLSIDAIVTMDKVGPQATVVTGSLGQIDGINVFVSDQMALADTDGKVTDGGNVTATGRICLVHTPTWLVGYRRRIMQHVTFLPFADAWELVMTVRTALTARTYSSAGAQQAADDSVAVLYNIGIA